MDLLCSLPPCVFRQDHVVGSTLDPKYEQVLELPEAKAVWPVTRSSWRMHKANQQDGSVYLSGLRGRSFPGGIYASRTPVQDQKCDAKSYRLSQVLGLGLQIHTGESQRLNLRTIQYMSHCTSSLLRGNLKE